MNAKRISLFNILLWIIYDPTNKRVPWTIVFIRNVETNWKKNQQRVALVYAKALKEYCGGDQSESWISFQCSYHVVDTLYVCLSNIQTILFVNPFFIFVMF